jgi:hypothetical protein
MGVDPQPEAAPTNTPPPRAHELSAGKGRDAQDEVGEIGAHLEEIVATSLPPTSRGAVDRRAENSDPGRSLARDHPVDEASKHILLGPALASPERYASQLGKMLIDRGLITREELDRALVRQGTTGERLGEALVAMDAVASGDVARVLAQHLRLPFVDLRDDLCDITVVGGPPS